MRLIVPLNQENSNHEHTVQVITYMNYDKLLAWMGQSNAIQNGVLATAGGVWFNGTETILARMDTDSGNWFLFDPAGANYEKFLSEVNDTIVVAEIKRWMDGEGNIWWTAECNDGINMPESWVSKKVSLAEIHRQWRKM